MITKRKSFLNKNFHEILPKVYQQSIDLGSLNDITINDYDTEQKPQRSNLRRT